MGSMDGRVLIGAPEMAAALFGPRPTDGQVRLIWTWLRSGRLKTKRIGRRYVATEGCLRAQFDGLAGEPETAS